LATLVQAEDTLNEARLRYASAVTAYNQSQVNLLAALGLIDDISLTPGKHVALAPNIIPAVSGVK